MKSVLSRSVLGRRVVPGTVLALAAATLSLGVAGPASAANTIELQGTVTGAGGAPLAGVDVSAVDGSGNSVETVSTDAAGHYQFDDDVVVGTFKVEFDPSPMDPTLSLTSPLPYQLRWSGGSRYEQGATTVTINSADPATPASASINLPQYGAINGNLVVGADGHFPTDNPTGVLVYDADENNTISSIFFGANHDPEYDAFSDPATGNYRVVVDPSSSLRAQAIANDANVSYLSQFWQGSDTLAGATPISVAPGQTVSGINFRLTDKLTARQAPSISGIAAIGRPLVASAGSWSRNVATEFSYTWMRGTTVVGTGATYTPTAADFGQRLNVVVNALNGEHSGQAASAQSDVVRWAADAKGKAKALKGHQVRFAVKIVSAQQKPVHGKVVVLRGSKVVHKAVKLVKGKAVIVVKGQPKGMQVFTVHFKGNKKLSQVDKTFTVRVRK